MVPESVEVIKFYLGELTGWFLIISMTIGAYLYLRRRKKTKQYLSKSTEHLEHG